MGYNTAHTEWPALNILQAVKNHVDTFFSIMDTNAPGAGDRLADEIFTDDGVIDGHHRCKGSEAIRRSRDQAWQQIDTRHHELLKVYADSDNAEDLLAIGQVTVGFKNGEAKKGEFVARMRLNDVHTSGPRMKLYRVWMDVSAMTKIAVED